MKLGFFFQSIKRYAKTYQYIHPSQGPILCEDNIHEGI